MASTWSEGTCDYVGLQCWARNRGGAARPPQSAEATDPKSAWRRAIMLVEKREAGETARLFMLAAVFLLEAAFCSG